MEQLYLATALLALFSLLAFWRRGLPAVILFMLLAPATAVTGFYWYDECVNPLGLTMALVLLCYSFYCFGMAYSSFRQMGEEE